MLNLKKTALAVIALGSTAAFAGTMGPVCSAVNVTVPCENTAWDLGGRALYVQPTVSAINAVNQITDGSGNHLVLGNDPTYSWGFQFEGSYHYSTGNDFNINWYHLRQSNNFTLGNPVTLSNLAVVTDTSSSQTASLTQNILTGNSDTAWDQVNMEFGQHVDFGENKFGRFHAGMQFAHVGANGYYRTEGYIGTPYASATSKWDYSNLINSTYNGFGARTGMDLTYDWGNGLSVYGTGALGLLAGTAKTNYNPVTYTPANTAVLSTTQSAVANYYTSAARVVPTLDAKLGFMYSYAMAQGDLSFDIGWLWNDYIGALVSADQNNNTAAYSNNFGIQGLYFGLKWVGNVA